MLNKLSLEHKNYRKNLAHERANLYSWAKDDAKLKTIKAY